MNSNRVESSDFIVGCEIIRILKKNGARAFFVGGCVRDKIMGICSLDYDIEVYHLSLDRVIQVISNHYSISLVGKSFGVLKLREYNIDISLPRAEVLVGNKHTDFEIEIDPYLTEEKAALRRDFTINSILWDPIDDQYIDPYNGIKHIREKTLTPCSEKFSEDPLRVLRAFQFLSRFIMLPSDKLVEYAKNLKPSNLAKERIGLEWEKWLLQSAKPSIGLDFLRSSNWIIFFPELSNLIACPQDPRWHPEGDVWQHTLHCMDAFATMRHSFMDKSDQIIFGYSVLCHDLGKPKTTIIREDGRISSRRHEIVGVSITNDLLSRLHVPQKMINIIQKYVRWHMTPSIYYRDQSSDSSIRKLSTLVPNIEMLVKIAHSDALGRPPLSNPEFPAGEWILAKANSLEVKNGKIKPLLQGRDLIEIGLIPSKKFSPVLTAAYKAQIRGKFRTKDEAKDWLKKYISSDVNI